MFRLDRMKSCVTFEKYFHDMLEEITLYLLEILEMVEALAKPTVTTVYNIMHTTSFNIHING